MNYKEATHIASFPLAHPRADCEEALAVISSEISRAAEALAYLMEAISTEQVA